MTVASQNFGLRRGNDRLHHAVTEGQPDAVGHQHSGFERRFEHGEDLARGNSESQGQVVEIEMQPEEGSVGKRDTRRRGQR